jgi:pyridoxine 4-dehydrogenase
MTTLFDTDTYLLGDRHVRRIGYGAMQLAGPGVFGPPRDPEMALAVLRAAIAAGVNHIDTSDFYGPHVTNRLIHEALAPYPADLVIVTKLGARRGDDASWLPAASPDELRKGLEDNLRHLGLDAIEVVNMRFFGDGHGPMDGPVAPQLQALAAMQREGLIKHIGVSTVTAAQVAAAQDICPIVCVQNQYNIVHRGDDALIDSLADQGIAYVPYFPLGGFTPLQSDHLQAVATRLSASLMQVAQAWLLRRSPNILLIPGTSSTAHLAQNLAVASLVLDDAAMDMLNAIAGHS